VLTGNRDLMPDCLTAFARGEAGKDVYPCATERTGRTKVAVRSGMLAMLSGWDCTWTTSLMRVPFWRGLAKWPCLPKATTL
jgi:hypothetical protein